MLAIEWGMTSRDGADVRETLDLPASYETAVRQLVRLNGAERAWPTRLIVYPDRSGFGRWTRRSRRMAIDAACFVAGVAIMAALAWGGR
jgi:hypothetical protein